MDRAAGLHQSSCWNLAPKHMSPGSPQHFAYPDGNAGADHHYISECGLHMTDLVMEKEKNPKKKWDLYNTKLPWFCRTITWAPGRHFSSM